MKDHHGNMHRILFFLIFIITLLPLASIEGAMNDYCVIPPFLSQSIPPNVLIVMDNSGSMCDQAYAGSYNPAQFANGLYYGYFDGSKNYKYTGNNRWEETTDAMNTGTAANPIASGSFLNWATMRRIEVAKKLLIGGKANPRSPSGAVTVKLDGETGCVSSWNFYKDYDTSAGNLIYPFAGNYRFSRSSDDLRLSPISGGSDTFYTYPSSDISVPTGWSEFPVSGTLIAWTKVDETPTDNDSTYIQNSNTTNPVIVGFNYTQAEPAGAITVTVKVRAKKTASGSTRRIKGVLRVDGADYESNTSSIGTSYSNYSFTWTNNPATALPWTWNEIKGIAGSGNLQGFGVKAANNYTSRYPRITQVYLDVSVTVPTGGPFNTIVDQGMVQAEGIIDTLTDDVRFGLAHYAGSSGDNGGKIDTYVGFGMVTNMITSIHNLVPDTWTPLAETLYESVRYFRQDDPYYANSPADYIKGAGGANMIRDPYWYKFTDLDASLTDMYVPCAKSFVLFLTDGESTHDQNIPGAGSGACSLTNIKGCSSGYRFAGTTVGQTYPSSGTDYMIDVAFWARTNDMRPGIETDVPTTWRQGLPVTQNVTTYPVFMFGTGSTLLKDTAITGGFADLNSNGLPDCNTIPAECYRDTDSDGVIRSDGTDDPLTYYEGDDGYSLETSILNAINAILKRSSSGTAASVLASGEGKGANIVQAIFYPKKTSDNSEEINWIGTLQTFWYYIDPFFNKSSIREETDDNGELNLVNDRIVQFYFDSKTMARRSVDTDGDGDADTSLEPVEFEQVKTLWEAGRLLWNTSAADRTIYTLDPSDSTPPLSRLSFDTVNKTALIDYLQAGSQDEAEAIIRYIRGEDDPVVAGIAYDYRQRTVALDLNHDGDVTDTVTINGASISESAKVWKLGDIVNSTPKILSWTYLNNYDQVYFDTSYGDFLDTAGYKDRGMVFVGANDGMLHAFKLGSLEILCRDCQTPARLSGIDLGKEVWAFIPKNVLPYLKYNADPNYCHIYNVDLSPYIFDASINGNPDGLKDVNSWRTVLIGGMRLGGACKDAASTNGVQVPAAGKGYSSYFAIDVTDQNNPTLLWEFSDPALGFATTGPSVVRIGDGDKTKNGKWFVVFGSGPTGPIDTATHQFRGYSDQNLKLFVLDLVTGNLQRTIDTGIAEAFAGSMINTTNDPDLDYNDDAVYIPFVKRNAAGLWEDGGIGSIFTKESQDPANWVWRKVIDGAGPVTSSVQRLQHKNKGQLWLYFGAGRYYSTLDTGAGDLTKRWKIFGFKDPCFSASGYDTACITEISLGNLDNVTAIADVKDNPDDVVTGWYINLDTAGTGYGAERVITDPLATTLGVVFYTTYKPYTDICAYGGKTVLWAVQYATGDAPSSLKGIALIQVSTGAIEQVDLSSALTEHGGRSSVEIEGVPPTAQGLSIMIPPPPVKRTLHIKER
jgi:type IV pilus assembly protein PilY1